MLTEDALCFLVGGLQCSCGWFVVGGNEYRQQQEMEMTPNQVILNMLTVMDLEMKKIKEMLKMN